MLSIECNKNFPLLLLHIIRATSNVELVKKIGAVAFKNYIKRNWPIVSLLVMNSLKCYINILLETYIKKSYKTYIIVINVY